MPFLPAIARTRKSELRRPAWWLAALSALAVGAALLAKTPARSAEGQGTALAGERLEQHELDERASRAVQVARRAAAWVRQAKLAAGLQRDPALSPADSAWLGDELTPLVTTLGSLEAKRAAANPDWARVLTLQLYDAGVRPGSVVAAGCSGSFPGLNLALAAACQALEARLVAVSSVTASTWGANQPGFTWPELETGLVRAGIIRAMSAGISLGGARDRARDLEASARRLAAEIQRKSTTALGAVAMTSASFEEAVRRRLELYHRQARGSRIVLYVNVGGAQASLGRSAASFRLSSGFITAKPFDLSADRGVIACMAQDGVPSLSLLHIEGLAKRWGVAPEASAMTGKSGAD